jgi:hypothetical protein
MLISSGIETMLLPKYARVKQLFVIIALLTLLFRLYMVHSTFPIDWRPAVDNLLKLRGNLLKMLDKQVKILLSYFLQQICHSYQISI